MKGRGACLLQHSWGECEVQLGEEATKVPIEIVTQLLRTVSCKFATRERQQMKQSGRPSYEPFDRTTVQSSPAKPANGNKGQGKNNGQGASNKGHGKSG